MELCAKCNQPLVDSENKEIFMDGDKLSIYIPYYCPYCKQKMFIVYYFSQTRVVTVKDLKEISGLSVDERLRLTQSMWKEQIRQTDHRQPKNLLEMLEE